MILEETYTLANGVKIPKLGLGTWFIPDEEAAQAVKAAVEIGYRHFDTAQAYGNEAGVGDGVRDCGVARDQLFVTTKLDAGVKVYDKAVASIDQSLSTMGLDYLDLMIIHSPQPWMEYGKDDRYPDGNREAWRALEDAHQAGKLRAIGLSNFLKGDIENILSGCTVKPMVNQILAHVTNTPHELIAYNHSQDILTEAYSPIGHGELFKNEKLAEFANKYGVTVPQLCIRYTIQLGTVSLPKTANPAHMKSNAQLNFEISDQDMDLLKQMERIKDYGDASIFPVYK